MTADGKTVRDVGKAFHLIIDEIADSMKEQYRYIDDLPGYHEGKSSYMAQWRDSVCALARIFHKRAPGYDIEMFYQKCGYEGSHPEHI